jgi:hypothetical protein
LIKVVTSQAFGVRRLDGALVLTSKPLNANESGDESPHSKSLRQLKAESSRFRSNI